MQIEIKAIDRLRGDKPLDINPVFSALAEGIRESHLDLSDARVVMDWVQYRQNFRGIVDTRTILPTALQGEEKTEIAIDLRRAGSASLPQQLTAALIGPSGTAKR